MFKEVKIGNKVLLELTHYAFRTAKGTFTLSATHSNGTDEWKHTKDKTFHTWSRKEVYSWWESGKIEVVEEATIIVWKLGEIKRSKLIK